MALAALYRFWRGVVHFLPNHLVTVDSCRENFFACIVVMTTDQIQVQAYCAKSRTLSRCWLPQAFDRNANIKSQTLSLLHSLNKML